MKVLAKTYVDFNLTCFYSLVIQRSAVDATGALDI